MRVEDDEMGERATAAEVVREMPQRARPQMVPLIESRSEAADRLFWSSWSTS